jgi:hypothetical protein
VVPAGLWSSTTRVSPNSRSIGIVPALFFTGAISQHSINPNGVGGAWSLPPGEVDPRWV